MIFCGLFPKQASLFSQEVEDSTFVFNPIIDDITQRIPPLETLIDSAIANSPYLKNRNNLVARREYELLSTKRNILNSISFGGSTSYGKNTLNTIDDLLLSSQSSSSARFSYSVSLSIKVSLLSLINRSNELNISRKVLEESMNSREEYIFELKKSVIFQYNDIILKQRLLKVASDNMLTSQMRMVMVEKKFLNNQITLEDVARMMEWHSNAQTAYEVAIIELMNSYTLLELTCGLKFNVMNKIE